MTGGRRRKGGKTRKGRKMRGGVMAGAAGPISVGAMRWDAVDTSGQVDSATGRPIPEYNDSSRAGNSSVLTGGKSRKSRKGGKSRKSKKSGKKSRKMKGGAWNAGAVNVAGAGYGFGGVTPGVTGGIAPPTAYQSRVGGAPMGGDGVRTA